MAHDFAVERLDELKVEHVVIEKRVFDLLVCPVEKQPIEFRSTSRHTGSVIDGDMSQRIAHSSPIPFFLLEKRKEKSNKELTFR